MTLVEIFWGLAINWASSYSENTFKNAFKKPYIQQLRRVVNNSIKDFEEKYPHNSHKLLFYQSQTFYEACNKYRLYENLNITSIHNALLKDDRIASCTEGEVQAFTSQLIHNIQQDKALKEAFLQENYQQEIFNISQKVTKLEEAIIKQNTTDGIKEMQDEIAILKKRIEEIEEDSFWYEMVTQNSIGGYHNYLHKYLNGKYTDKAIENMVMGQNS
jgi:hypothetical protein